MRAFLILAVLMVWMYCVAGAVGFPLYLMAIAARSARDRRRGVERTHSPPMRGLVPALIVYAVVMAAIATAMAALSLGSRPVAAWNQEVARAVAWAGVPAWSASMASVTAVVLRRRG